MDNLSHELLPKTWEEFFFQEQATSVASRFILDKPIQALFVKGRSGTGKTAWILQLIRSYKCTGKEEGSMEPCGVCPSCQVLDYRVAESTVTDVFWLQPGKDVAEGGMASQVRTALSAAESGHTFAGNDSDLMFIVCDEFHLFDPKIRQQFLNKAETPDPNSKVCYIFSTMDFDKLSDSERIAFPRRCVEVTMKSYTSQQIAAYLFGKLDCPVNTAGIIARRSEGSIGLAISHYNTVKTRSPDLDPEMALSVLSYANNAQRWKLWRSIFNYGYSVTKLMAMLDRLLRDVDRDKLINQMLLDVYLTSDIEGQVTWTDKTTSFKARGVTPAQCTATALLRKVVEIKEVHPVNYMLPLRQLDSTVVCMEGVYSTIDNVLEYSINNKIGS